MGGVIPGGAGVLPGRASSGAGRAAKRKGLPGVTMLIVVVEL